MNRRFKLNTHLTFPLQLLAGPGASYHRAQPGHIIEIDGERCKAHDRFLRGRLRAGDLVELEPAQAQTPAQPSTPPAVANRIAEGAAK